MEDEPELTREALAETASTRGLELRPLLNALSLALAVVLVIFAGAVGLQRLRSQQATSAAAPTPTTPAPTIPVAQGWTRAGPPWAQQIVFAPSQPRTAYTCGTPANSNGSQQAPVALGISHDAGHTWQATTNRMLATVCQVDVDPTDANDLLMQVEYCTSCATPPPAQLYRSDDGGLSWHRITLPPLGGSNSAPFTVYQWTWQESALFLSPYVPETPSQSVVALSLAKGPFAWVNAKALQAGVPASLQLNTLYATNSAVYVDFTGPSGCTGDCEVVKRSADLGFSWSVFQPRYRGQPVQLLDQLVSTADGRTLIGQVYTSVDENTRVYVRSSDGGTTWAPLPSPPGNLIILALASTPSGIFYAETWSFGVATATPAVYRLAPGAPRWMLVGALPDSPSQFVVSWDDQGNSLALWSGVSSPQSAQLISAGLTTHAP